MSGNNGPIFQEWIDWSKRVTNGFEKLRNSFISKKYNQKDIGEWL